MLAITSTMRGAALAYVGPDQICRAATLDLWAGGYPALLLAKDEADEIFRERSDLGALMRGYLRAEFGADPRVCCFENSILSWVEWLLRDTDCRAYDITQVVTCEEDLCTRSSRLGGEMASWFPRARHVKAKSARVLEQHGAFWAQAERRAVVLTVEEKQVSMALWERPDWRVVAGEALMADAALGAIEGAFRRHLALAPRDVGSLEEWAREGDGELAERLCSRLEFRGDGGIGFLDDVMLADALGECVAARKWGAPVEPGHRAVARAGVAVLTRALGHVFAVTTNRYGEGEIVVSGQAAACGRVVADAARVARDVSVTIPPHTGDEGRAWGALAWATQTHANVLPPPGTIIRGPGYADGELRESAAGAGLAVETVSDAGARIGELLAEGRTCGILRGRTPFASVRSGNFVVVRAKSKVEQNRPFDPEADDPLPDWLEEVKLFGRERTVETPGDAVNAFLEASQPDVLVMGNTIAQRGEQAL